MECGWMLAAMVSMSLFAAPASKAKHVQDEALKRLLDFSTEPSAKALKALEHVFRSLPGGTRKSPAVQYAYAVALLRQRSYQEAGRVLDGLAEEHAGEGALWRAKLWVELELDERTRAMTDLEQLGSHAAAHQEGGGERSADKDSAEFLGSVCGFLAGPWSHKVREDDAKIITDHLRGLFDDNGQAAFDEARTKLVERYEMLYQEHEERVQSELAAKTKELDDAKASVSSKAQELGKKQQSLKDKQAKRDADVETKVADIESQLKKVDQQRQALLAQIAPLEVQRVALLAQLLPEMPPFMLPLVPAGMRHQVMRYQWTTRRVVPANNRRVRLLLAPLVAKLTALEGQVASLNQQELELRGQGFMTEVKHQTDLGKLAEQEQALDKSRKRVKYDAHRLQAKTAVASPRWRAEAQHLSKFAAYVPFPFDRERARLLGIPPADGDPPVESDPSTSSTQTKQETDR